MRNLIFMVAVLMMAACSTGYHKYGFFTGGGYSETQLSDNVFQVSFIGNGYTGRQKATDLSLLRSAELALENGFSYFTLADSSQHTNQSTYTTPRSSSTTGSVYGTGNSLNFNSTTQHYGGQTMLLSFPETTNTIVCFKEKPNVQGIVF